MRHPHPPRHAGDRSEPPNEKINHAAEVRARAEAAANPVYTPPAGFAADPAAWLVEFRAGNFTPEQVAYLRSNALAQYEAAAGSDPLAAEILVAWRAWLDANPAPPPRNPFDLPPRP